MKKFNLTYAISISGKRVFHTCMRFSALRTHEETLQWANEAEENGLDHVNGIMGKSVFFEAPNFDVVQDMMPEPMHLLDCGFVKNTCMRTFNSGNAAQTIPGYRRSPSGKLSDEFK